MPGTTRLRPHSTPANTNHAGPGVTVPSLPRRKKSSVPNSSANATTQLSMLPRGRPSLPASLKSAGTVPAISPIKSHVPSISFLAKIHSITYANPRNPTAQPTPTGRSSFQYLGSSLNGCASTAIIGR